MRTYRIVAYLVISAFSRNLCADALHVVQEEDGQTLSVFRDGSSDAILIQHSRDDHRPYIHPIVSPDGQGVLTEYSPGHHPHQTGLYWGFTRINGRDFFHNPANGYWKRESSRIIASEGNVVEWETVYVLLDESGESIMRESQIWSMRDNNKQYFIDLTWTGEALVDLDFDEYNYGGLFLRMPYKRGETDGMAVNSSRQKNERAEGQRSVWVDVGMEIEGRDDWGHVAIFDHPENRNFPQKWRVDRQLGIGPAPSRMGNWSIKKGEKETFKHQLVVYGGEFDSITVNDQWKTYTGQGGNWALWNLAKQEGRNAEFLSGSEAVEKMTVADGLAVNLYASEPEITQPMAFCWDDRGRLWVAENRDYETRRTGFSADGNSRILILEDEDGDGSMDSKKVFMENIPFPAAMAWGFNGLWLGAPPNLLFVPDRDGDDKADIDNIEIRLSGWGIRDRHEVLNSFIWGPDGWLYGCQGFATPSMVGKPTGGGRIYQHGEAFPAEFEAEDPTYIDGGVWRYHPIKDRFEVVAHGFSNPWGVDFDDHGQAFITACVIPHLWHVIPGGIYHRQGGRHINPHVYSDIKTIADHRHRSAHGGARIYLADTFPERYHNRVFMANIHEHALLTDILEPSGSGFIGRDGDETVMANDPQWVGFSIEIGPEGAVYMLDWHDPDICGGEVLYKDTGRIYRVAPPGTRTPVGFDIATYSDDKLVEMQMHRNDWYVRRARVILQERAFEGKLSEHIHDKLWDQFEAGPDEGRKLRSLWALHVTNGLNRNQLTHLLDHKDAHIRAWAIQLLCEDFNPGEMALNRFETMAKEDPSPVVRLYLASALQRIPSNRVWKVAEGLLSHAGDSDDHNLPKMIWYGVEGGVENSAEVALNLALESEIPMVSKFIARRAIAAGAADLVVAAIERSDNSERRVPLLEGFHEGLKGHMYSESPRQWASIEEKLMKSGDLKERKLAMALAELFGSVKLGQARLAQYGQEETGFEERREILKGFGRDLYRPAYNTIVDALDDPALREVALTTVAFYENESRSEEIIKRYDHFNELEKDIAVKILSTERSGARTLFAALRAGKIERSDISEREARQLKRVIGPSFTDFWGKPETLVVNNEIRISAVAGEMRFDLDEFAVKRAANIRLIFSNPDIMNHNLVMVAPGAADEVGASAIAMGASGLELGYIPESDKVIFASRLLEQNEEQLIEFKAPSTVGDYEYVCTFPGHHLVMRGVMKVIE